MHTPRTPSSASASRNSNEKEELLASVDRLQCEADALNELNVRIETAKHLHDLPSIEAGRSWEWVIAETFHQISASHRGFLPDRFELLAWTEAYTKADDIRGFMPKRKNVLVGVPLYVAYAS